MRRHIPDRRESETTSVEFGGAPYAITMSRYPDGDVAEVFLTAANHPGSQAADLARDAGILISIALQCGVSLSVLRRAVTRDYDGRPATIIGAALDLIAQSRE